LVVGKKETGIAPVLNGAALSRIEIADLAMTMVENFTDVLGGDLVCLLQELLGVDIHRRALANGHAEKYDMAVSIVAQGTLMGRPLSVGNVAKAAGIAKSTASSWLNCADFQCAVKSLTRAWERLLRDNYFQHIKADDPQISDQDAFARAFQMYSRPHSKKPPAGRWIEVSFQDGRPIGRTFFPRSVSPELLNELLHKGPRDGS
jgi:hypothetical protein